MEKYIEENPTNRENEEYIRINKNDISKNKKNLNGFVTMEEMTDKDTILPFSEDVSELEEDQDIENAYNNFNKEIEREKIKELNEKEIDQIKIDQLTKDIHFHQGEGVASIGPDVEGQDISEIEEEFESIKIDPADISIGLDSINPDKRISSDHEIRKNRKSNKDKASGHDNLKTITPNKKERSIRGFLRKFLKKAS